MSYDLISKTTPRARKDHRCIWCGGTIEKGHKYIRERSTYNGEFQNHAWHEVCFVSFCDSPEIEGEFDAYCMAKGGLEHRYDPILDKEWVSDQ